MKTKLVALGFGCNIQEVRKDDKDVLYRVRVGPYDDLVELEKSRSKLEELGIKALTVKHRE